MLSEGVIRCFSSPWNSLLPMVKKKDESMRLQQAGPPQRISAGARVVKDTAKTVIIGPVELFEFIRIPFGLRNFGVAFQSRRIPSQAICLTLFCTG